MTSRQIKRELGSLLRLNDPGDVITGVSRMPFKKAVNGLLSYLYEMNPTVRWHAIAALGRVVSQAAALDMESARVIMRRLMWNLNDESGGIGWGSPEAMGEIMAANESLAKEFASVLRSYIRKDENFLEHPDLQKGVLWGLGRLAGRFPGCLPDTEADVIPFLFSDDPVHRGYAVWALGNLNSSAAVAQLTQLTEDQAQIQLFDGSKLQVVRVGQLAKEVLENPRNQTR